VAKSASPSGIVPDGAKEIGQNDDRADRERTVPSRLAKCRAYFVDVFGQQPQPSIRKIDGEEEAAPGNEVAAIVGHAGMLAWDVK
jgi:hypothetical protein